MFVGIVICVIFLVMALAMMSKKLPAILALPIMAVVIAFASGMPFMAKQGESIFETVLVAGSSKLIINAINVIFAAWFSSILAKSGVTDIMIKKAAELGGDKPIVVTLLVVGVSAFIFSGLGGVGAIAMVGGTALPIMMAIGATPMAAAHLFMAAISAGYAVRPSNVVTITNLVSAGSGVNIPLTSITAILWICCAFDLLFAVVYAIRFFKKNGKKYAFAAPVESSNNGVVAHEEVKGFRALMACITPLPILCLVYFAKINTLVAYMIGIVWAIIWTATGGWDRMVSRVTQSAYDACKDSAPATMIYFGIGMVLCAVGSAAAQTALAPFVNVVVPDSKLGLIIFCVVLAPLCLYRGPFNVLGLGSSLAACIMSVNRFSPVLLAAIFQCTQRWPAKSCPTATQVVWVANACGEEPVKVSNKVFGIEWVVTAVTIIISAFLY